MSNILSDLLPDAPREASILVAASEADVAGQLHAYLAQGMNASIAQGIVASGFAERTALTRDACQWVVHEIAVALGVPPQNSCPPAVPSTVKPAVGMAPPTVPPPVAGAGPRRDAAPVYPGQQTPIRQPSGYPAQQGYQAGPAVPGPPAYPAGPVRPALLPYDQAVAFAPRKKSKRGLIIGLTAVAVPVALVAAFLFLLGSYVAPKPSHSGVIGRVTNVPARTLKAVGTGQAYSDALSRIRRQPPLTRNRKPEVLYIGAAFCPYCAADQWSIIVALSKFGTFSDLANSRSAASPEKYPNTATLTFDEASYSSRYLTLVTVESQTINRTPLQPATPQEKRLWNKYTQGAWPFLDIGNRFFSEALFNPAVLQGKTPSQIAAAISNASSPIAQAVDGSANVVIAAVCSITGNQPASVCDTPTISAIERGL